MKLRDNVRALSIRSSGRCGTRGIRILGLEFLPEPRTIEIGDLSPGVVAKLLNHSELVVEQLDSAPVSRPAPTRPERTAAAPPAETSTTAFPAVRKRKKKRRSDSSGE